jgi:hypothetical protein
VAEAGVPGQLGPVGAEAADGALLPFAASGAKTLLVFRSFHRPLNTAAGPHQTGSLPRHA